MAEEFLSIQGGSWWSTATDLGEAKPYHDQPLDHESTGSACGSSITFQEFTPNSFMDSTMTTRFISQLPSSSISWTQALLTSSGKPVDFMAMLQDQDPAMVGATNRNLLLDQYNFGHGDETCSSSLAMMQSLVRNEQQQDPSPALVNQELINDQLHLTCNTTPTALWNLDASNDIKSIKTVNKKSCSSSTNKTGGEKRQRLMERASPLPSFKVRKEKLGDRITALQQLVSPFGKTDTASVLQEAIDYIKCLHDQVGALSSPYLKDGFSFKQKQRMYEQLKKYTDEEKRLDLGSRGLCLVPITGSYPATASDTSVDFWHPGSVLFGGSFRCSKSKLAEE
ncbi:transcription factor bHLH112-like [Zingiber officinale]|uniref:BHLH domain-containing protein n=1 Tax=Zingiber officinale TaxID=94328 RepID=A0A8J5BJA2_ZINOF|nr:transcription factor bHLH112-like [Zingiber officinale]KAG6473188.1 hypothetical protein ZIOFF_067100 [Zingiber officinale]